MSRGWFDRLLGVREPAKRRFEPLYDLDQLTACGNLPIVRVLAFATENNRTSRDSIGQGVGGVLASLLRRDLIFTSRLSVLGGEDTGYLQPDGRGIADADLLADYESSAVVIAGELQREGDHRFSLRVRVMHRGTAAGAGKFALQFSPREVASVIPAAARAICKHLGIAVAPQVAERWRQHTIVDWPNLLAIGKCWEDEDAATLADLFRAGKAHPDALVSINCDGPGRENAQRALSEANSAEPDNPQLAFCTFCALCNFNRTPVDPRFEAMLRAGLAAGPGHGKSHMVLPHIIAPMIDNVPYILGHSEVGYRLLPGNSFALSNFSGHLSNVTPHDERILTLACEAIKFDPENPSGYQNAIQFLVRHARPAEAVPFAEALVELCTPPVSERTVYCFRQYPDVVEKLDRGTFSPQHYATQILAQCQARVR